MRLPYAAKQLIKQVMDERDARVMYENPDGLDIARTFVFDADTSDWLAPLLWAIKDPRIAHMEIQDGALHVTFTTDARANDRTPFPLAAAQEVVDYKPPPRPAPSTPVSGHDEMDSVEDSLDHGGDSEAGVEGSGVEPSSDTRNDP